MNYSNKTLLPKQALLWLRNQYSGLYLINYVRRLPVFCYGTTIWMDLIFPHRVEALFMIDRRFMPTYIKKYIVIFI